jgi:hypothetical protein
MNRTYTILMVIGVIILVGGTGYYLYQQSVEDTRIKYQNSLQPNIQSTQNSITTPDPIPNLVSQVSQSRVSASGSFDFKATYRAYFYLYFDNSFSMFSSKTVHLTYTTTSPVTNDDVTFDVSAGNYHYIRVLLDVGQQLSGSFSITGGSGNDVNFWINYYTFTQQPSFRSVLVNAGTSDGFANVAFTVDGVSVWSNKFFLAKGTSLPISGNVTLNDGNKHTFDIVVVNQYKP